MRVLGAIEGERMGEARPVDFVANDRKPSNKSIVNDPSRKPHGSSVGQGEA